MTGPADELVITFDVDWAPDAAIDAVARILIDRGVRATWFVTHRSPAIDRLRDQPDLFELGIHPNFLPGSTHGRTPGEVLETCLQMVPDAVSMRTHALVQSSPLIAQVMRDTPIIADVSLFLPGMPNIQPVRYVANGRSLLRIPYFWEDDDEMEAERPSWQLDERFDVPGLKVIDLHPIHVHLNAPSMASYRCLKAVGRLEALPEAALQRHVHQGAGARTFLEEVLARLTEAGGSSCVRDVALAWSPA